MPLDAIELWTPDAGADAAAGTSEIVTGIVTANTAAALGMGSMYSIQLPSAQCGVSSLATASQVRPVRTLKVGLSDTSTFAESTCSTDVAVVTSEFRADEGICDGGFSDIGSTRNDGAPLIDTFAIPAVVPTFAAALLTSMFIGKLPSSCFPE